MYLRTSAKVVKRWQEAKILKARDKLIHGGVRQHNQRQPGVHVKKEMSQLQVEVDTTCFFAFSGIPKSPSISF